MADSAGHGDLRMSGRGEPPDESEVLIPAAVREAFPGLEVPTDGDVDVIAAQLGRRPRGRILVTCRCPHGRPAVILTVPFEGGGGPVPPLLWLSCPHAAAKVGALESVAGTRAAAERLEKDAEAAERFALDEQRFEEVQGEVARSAAGDALVSRLEGRGVAGGSPGAIKCLHAHLAYRLSLCPEGERGAGNDPGSGPARGYPPGVIGLWCQEQLAREGGNWCERPPAACVT
jgi:hypothetical protein